MTDGKRKKRRKIQSERKEEMFRVRVTDEQKRLFAAAAQRAGLDVSGWLRSLGIREATSLGVTVQREEE